MTLNAPVLLQIARDKLSAHIHHPTHVNQEILHSTGKIVMIRFFSVFDCFPLELVLQNLELCCMHWHVCHKDWMYDASTEMMYFSGASWQTHMFQLGTLHSQHSSPRPSSNTSSMPLSNLNFMWKEIQVRFHVKFHESVRTLWDFGGSERVILGTPCSLKCA